MINPLNENASVEAGVNVHLAGGRDGTEQIPESFGKSNDIAEQTQGDIEIAPEFESLIPPLQAEERAQLEANILAEGCRDPLVLWCDVLLDGHNRYAICQKHGIPFRTVQAQGIESLDDAILWIVNNQLGRRNITDFVRGELALCAKPIIEAKARQRKESTQIRDGFTVMQNSASPAIVTREVVATAANLSHDSISKIEKIKATAVPEVLAAVRSGEISIHAAAKVASLPAAEQVEIAAAGPAAIKQAAKAAAVAKAPNDELQRLREETAELREHLAELQEGLKSTLAENEAMGRAFDADDRLKAAMAEAMRQKAIADSAEQRLNAQMGEMLARTRQVTYWKNQAEKLAKQLAKTEQALANAGMAKAGL